MTPLEAVAGIGSRFLALLFNSYAFLLGFLPATVLGFFQFGRASKTAAALWLAGATIFFSTAGRTRGTLGEKLFEATLVTSALAPFEMR